MMKLFYCDDFVMFSQQNVQRESSSKLLQRAAGGKGYVR
jgi:hypothetical protein